MASIVQRNKSFSVVYTIYDGEKKRQKWETYHSYGAALRRKEQLDLIQQLEKERTQYQEDTLAQFLEEYVELYGQVHWACSTYTSNEGLIRNYIIPFMGSMRLTEFTPKVIAVLYGKLQSDPKISPSVLTNIHKLLHSAFEQAVLWEYVPRNPFRKANVPKVFPSEISMLTVDEIKTLLQNCDNQMLSIAIHLAFAGSLRKGEILALTWDDVDFQRGTVTVSKTLKRVRRDAVDVLNGKDILYQFPAAFDEGRTVTVLKRPKTKSSIRTVYLPDYGLDVLRDWKGTLTPVKRKQPDLILRYSNGRPLSEETLPRLLEKQLLQLRMPVVSFHSLRHSSISYKLILTGGNIKAVQGDSGHAQAEMITERYGHIIDSCRKQCARDFEEEFYKGM
ncbi:UNVERIFIED_ORG: hypothetical protein B5F06_07425 [Lacrimispora saccharolytica]